MALVGIIADHPAMCKLCGFADHSHHEAPCTKCTVPRHEMFTQKSLKNREFENGHVIVDSDNSLEYPPRDGKKHRELSQKYKDLTTDEEREVFFAKHGVRWTEFSRLLYFDIVKWTVIDPMHNLLLGMVLLVD